MSARSGLRDRAFEQTISTTLSSQTIRISILVASARGITKCSRVDNLCTDRGAGEVCEASSTRKLSQARHIHCLPSFKKVTEYNVLKFTVEDKRCYVTYALYDTTIMNATT
jgi:hypothetical protein